VTQTCLPSCLGGNKAVVESTEVWVSLRLAGGWNLPSSSCEPCG